MASNETDGGTQPPSGFTFADKRKINRDARPVSPEQAAAERLLDSDVSGEPAEPGQQPEAAEVDAGQQLAAERLADLQRLQAEYANYRKRVDRDRALSREQAIASVVESLLPVLDDIQLARQHGDLESGPFASIAEKLESTLAKYGVERYDEPGTPFDPSVHDALMHADVELAEGTEVTTVVEVLQPGYRLGDRVIRPARVSVADPN
ncbi:MAG TPA: nucleotide exchange factor GrpE [Jatrophihabitans sp.]|nr:nucleotide exchange factor GrpE [Jatrophihabitans sp.]